MFCKWISTAERLPERNGEYLTVVVDEGGYSRYDLCHWNGYYKTFTLSGSTGDEYIRHPTHWIDLPEPPKERAENQSGSKED